MKTLRQRLGLSQAEFAKRMGYGRTVVSQVESGTREGGARFWKQVEQMEISAGIRPIPDRVVPFTSEHQETPVAKEAAGVRQERSPRASGHLLQAREERGLSVQELAKITRISAAHLRDLEEARAPITDKVFDRLKQVLPALDRETIFAGSDHARIIDLSGRTGTVGSRPEVTLPHGKTARYVPRLSYVQAGALHEWTDDLYDYEGVLALNLPPKARAFAVTITGDSMWPHYLPGDEVIVLWGVMPRTGQVVVACKTTGEVMCKIYTEHDHGKRVTLTSYNDKQHPAIPLTREELRWVWPVHSFNRQIM